MDEPSFYRKRNSRDERTRLYMTGSGLVVAWKDAETGTEYGGVVPHELVRDALSAEGLNPDEFFAREGDS